MNRPSDRQSGSDASNSVRKDDDFDVDDVNTVGHCRDGLGEDDNCVDETADVQFDRLIAIVSEKIEQGETVDIDEISITDKGHVHRLRELLPTLLAMHDLGLAWPTTHGRKTFSATKEFSSLSADVTGDFSLGNDPLEPGCLGDFRLLREIGRGGMGVVYEALQISLNRRVALKILPFAGALDDRQLQRFKHEALAAGQLDHPHIVSVFGVGSERGVHYYVMRLIEGRPLNQLIAMLRGEEVPKSLYDHGPPNAARENSESNALRTTVALAGSDIRTDGTARSVGDYHAIAWLGAQVADALEFAHERGIVHRDIKPGNLLVDDAGKAWVTDFGLAQIESLPELTLTGDVIGTLRYMSPEQTLGKRRHVDHRTDIYSLGVTLYELLTLQPAFADDDRHELLRSIAVGSCLPPRQRVSSIPFELDTIVQKAMATSPEDRYSAASELAEDLKSFVADRPIRARPPSLFDLAVKWSRRHRATVVWCIVLLVVIAVGSLFAAVHLAAKNEALIRSEREKVDILRNALVAQARATRRSGQVGQRFDALDALHNATELMPPRDLSDSAVEELRNEAVAALALPDLRLDSKLDLPPGVLAIDGRLERQAIAGANGSIRIQRTRDGQVITTLPAVGETPVGAMVFSQNGAFLAAKYQWHADAETRVCIWRLAKGTVQMDLKVDPRAEIEFGGTGETVFFVMSDGAVTQFHLATGKQLSTIVHQGERRQVLKANRDNTLLAVSNSSTDKIHIYEAATGVKLSEFSNRSVPYSMDWHPSGRYLAAGGNDFVTRVWDISQTPRLVSELHGHQAETVGVYFSGNGELVVTRSHDGTIRLWNPFTGWQRCLAMGRIIAYDKQESRFACVSTGVSNGIEIWDVADASEMRVLVEDRQLKGPFAIDVSQNGRFMASCGSDGVWIWDLQSGEVMQRLPLAGRTALFHNGKLLTSSELGILEWPMQMAGSKFTIGPPRRLASGGVPHHQCFAASCAKCDTLLAITDWNQATLLQVDTGRTLATFEAPDAVHAVALSNDGRWAVTAGTNFDVWDTHTNERTKSLVTPGSNPGCLFSPDGDFLITSSSDDVRIWKVGSWELEQRFALRNALRCPLAFSSDGRLLAMAESRFHAQIVDTHTWQRLAVLESQFPGQLTSLAFTRDDAKLMVATESHEIRAWDLRLINRRLRALGVAWTAFPRHIAELPFGDHDCRAPVCSTDLGPSWADWQGERYSRFAP